MAVEERVSSSKGFELKTAWMQVNEVNAWYAVCAAFTFKQLENKYYNSLLAVHQKESGWLT
ncbi:hypothetical protein [Paraglaciecola sp.]|uniref:hypothetical protein n=1 Tax=Paraglaciecola sp. TaxID=1920173 RepID=UPI003EF54D5E